jgi:branched-chain amino acid transport system substrate-binding protein
MHWTGRTARGVFVVALIVSACAPAPAPASPTASGATSGAPTAKPAAGRTLKLPAIVALTGPLAGFGIPTKNGLDLVADEINQAGGIGGLTLTYEYVDPGNDPAQATTLARSVADWALMIYGPNLTLHSQAAAPVINQLGIPAIVTSSIPDIVTKNRPNIFGVLSPPKDLTSGGVQRWVSKESSIKKVVIVKDARDPASTIQTEGLIEGLQQAQVQVLETLSFSLGDADFTAQVTRAKSLNPDGIAIAALSSEGAGVVREIHKQGINVPVLMTQSGWTPDTIKLAGPSIEGVYAAIEWAADARSEKLKSVYEARFNEPLSQTTVVPYDTIRIFKEVFEKQKLSGDQAKLQDERAKLREGLATVKDWQGAGLVWSFDREGNPSRSGMLVQYKAGSVSVVN